MHRILTRSVVRTKSKKPDHAGWPGLGAAQWAKRLWNYLMSSLRAPRRPSDPAGGGDNNRADTATQSACERNLEWATERVNGRRKPPLRRPRVRFEPLCASEPHGILDER